MRGYLLDTHIVLWFLEKDSKLKETVRESIVYFQHNYFVSIVALHEIILLKEAKKSEIKSTIEQIAKDLSDYNIFVLPLETKHLKTLENLSVPIINGKPHYDPFDRIMIAQSISEKLTMISSDQKFPYYSDQKFHLLEN